MLNILFIADLSAKDKKSQLSKNYGIIMTQEIDKEVIHMCNLSEGIRDAGIAEGLAKGMAVGKVEGLAKGKINTTILYVMNLMQANGSSAIEAMNLLGVEEDIRHTILQAVQQQHKSK